MFVRGGVLYLHSSVSLYFEQTSHGGLLTVTHGIFTLKFRC